MKKKNGFTLIELLAVIVIIGLLLAIVVPNALSLSGNVKTKAYKTKIDLIESAGKNFGQSNIGFVRKGTDINNQNDHYTCTFTLEDKEVSAVSYARKSGGFSETATLGDEEYWCMRVTVQDLVDTNNLDYDEKDVCGERCTTEEQKKDYNNIVINPKTNFIINKCYVYVYYKYKRVYTYFDEKSCSRQANSPTLGQEYRPL